MIVELLCCCCWRFIPQTQTYMHLRCCAMCRPCVCLHQLSSAAVALPCCLPRVSAAATMLAPHAMMAPTPLEAKSADGFLQEIPSGSKHPADHSLNNYLFAIEHLAGPIKKCVTKAQVQQAEDASDQAKEGVHCHWPSAFV